MDKIVANLDRLAEFHSQKDAIELKKRELLDDIKIPSEVETVIKDGMERIRLLDETFQTEQKRYSADIRAKLGEIVIPDEIKSALAEIDAKRNAILAEQQAYDAELFERIKQAKANLQAEIEAQTRGVYDAVATRKAEIEAEFIGSANAVDENIQKLENEIKADTEQLGKTIKGKYFMAVYNKGRITWNTSMMEAWLNDHPFLKQARKEGKPSISLRRL
jgi:hypothetical protein